MAEVLVTLGILGVVAAMTMPVLIGGPKPKELEAQFKSAYSILSQAVLSVANDEGGGLKQHYTVYNGTSYQYENEIKDAIYNKLKIAGDCNYSGNIFNYSKTTDSPYIDQGTTKPNMLLANGMCVNVKVNASDIHITVDINGSGKRPNTLGHDIFFFIIDDKDVLHPRQMSQLLTDDEVKDLEDQDYGPGPNISGQKGAPCSAKSSQSGNGLGCAYYALINQNPDDSTKTYWDNLP